MQVELVQDGGTDGLDAELAGVLVDCVDGGASLGFPAPLDVEVARRWWADSLRSPGTLTWVARAGGAVLGVVQLAPATFPNGSHRAEVKKLLVHRDARGQGVSSRLMDALEAEAQRRGRWLLMLDTETDSPAEAIYAGWGWTRFGRLEEHAATPSGPLAATSFMAKRLAH